VAAGFCIFLCGILLGLVAGGGAPGDSNWFSHLFAPPFGGKESVSVLILGVDDSEGRGLADTIIVAVVRPGTGEIAALSVPRDSRVTIPGVGIRRINEAHSFGGLPLTIETVELLLGTPFDYHAEVNVQALIQLVDAMGGIDLDVEKRMYYRDNAQDLLIDLYPGYQHMTGEQAVGYVRFRYDARGDLGRIERQRRFLRAVAAQLLAPQNVSHIRELAESFSQTVETDLAVHDMLALKKIVEQVGPEAIHTAVLPGHPRLVEGQSMLELDAVEVQRVVDRVLLGQGVAVAVLNGTDVNGLAARMAGRLEARDYEVVEIGNAPERSDATLIIAHRGRARDAERLAKLFPGAVVSAAPDGSNPADLTLILGRDVIGRNVVGRDMIGEHR
jgi:LCP family protein required for cell wall assembly